MHVVIILFYPEERQHIPPKRWWSMNPHGVIYEKEALMRINIWMGHNSKQQHWSVRKMCHQQPIKPRFSASFLLFWRLIVLICLMCILCRHLDLLLYKITASGVWRLLLSCIGKSVSEEPTASFYKIVEFSHFSILKMDVEHDPETSTCTCQRTQRHIPENNEQSLLLILRLLNLNEAWVKFVWTWISAGNEPLDQIWHFVWNWHLYEKRNIFPATSFLRNYKYSSNGIYV